MQLRTTRRHLLVAVAVASLTTTGLVVTEGTVAHATDPTFTAWPSDFVPTAADVTDPFYGRLYMLAQSSAFSLPVDIVGIPVDGTMEFTGLDPIAGVNRDIQVTTDEAPLCAPAAGNQYDTGPCPRLQLDLFTGDSAGGIRFGIGALTLIDDPGPSDTRYRHTDGAVIDSISPRPDINDPRHLIYLNGTEAQINAALADLVYEAGPDYRYDGNNGIRLDVLIESDDTSTSVSGGIEIRVLDVNQFPDVDGPDDEGTIQPQVDHAIPANVGDPGGFTVTDPDNDEDVDDDAPEPPCPADDSGANAPDGCDDPVDGPGDKMLLFAFMDCGQPIAPGTGFHFAPSTFEYNPPTLGGFYDDFLAGTPLGTPGVQDFFDATQAFFDAIDPTLWSLPLASSDPTAFTNVFAGVTTMSEVQDALSQVTVRHDVPDDTCDLYTVVSDLGNNGLPLQYIVTDPDDDIPFGWELPFLGLDVQQTTFGTDSLVDIDISFDSTLPIVVNEGDGPVDAVAELVISVDGPDPHPGFTIEWSARPGLINDPPPLPGSGIAEAGLDHSNVEGLPIVVPPGATSVPVPAEVFPEAPVTTVFDDLDVEGPETYEYELDITSIPAPDGYRIVSSVPTRTVLILDDEDGPATVSVDDPTVIEGDLGLTTNLVFTLTLDKPADGGESVSVSTADGTATDLDDDYEPLGPLTVTFSPGQTEATVNVTVNGDSDVEADETVILAMSDPTNLDLADVTEGTGTIVNDDVPPGVITVSDAAVAEGDLGLTTNMAFTLSLSSVSDGTESVVVETMDGTATDLDDDYEPLGPLTVTFPAGETEVPVLVQVNGDSDVEADETFTLQLSSPTNGTIGDPSGTGTITDDDVASVISIADTTVAEGVSGQEIAVANSNPLVVCPVSVTTSPSDPVSAVAPDDYAAIAGASFDANGGDGVGLTIVDDGDVEGDETFEVSIALIDPPPAGCELGQASATVTITDNDAPLIVSIADATVAEADGTGSATISMTGWSAGRECLLTVTSSNGSAVEPGDYDAITGGFLLASDSDVLGLTVVDDSDTEGPETFTVTIALDDEAASACEMGDGTATITITDDDSGDTTAPTVTVEQAAGQADPTFSSPVLFTVTFSEPVFGFDASDVDLSASTAPGVLVPVVSGAGPVYSLAVSGMTGAGEVVASVPAGVVLDGNSNPNTVSTSVDNVVDFDVAPSDETPPSVTVEQAAGQADPTSSSPVLFTVTFSEPVTGFAMADVALSGTAGPTAVAVSGSGATYTLSVSGMPGPGTVIASVVAGAAVDGAGNASLASTSVDNVVRYAPPSGPTQLTITVPDDLTRPNDPGEAGAVVTFAPASATGGQPPLTVSCDRTSGEFFPIGTTSVTCTATDASVEALADRFVEATVAATFTITVVDTEAPKIADNPDIIRFATSSVGTTVTFTAPAATDNAGTPSVTCAPASGALFRVGSTTVTCTATDAAGNRASSSFVVTVRTPASGTPATGSTPGPLVAWALLLVVAGLALQRTASRPARRRRS